MPLLMMRTPDGCRLRYTPIRALQLSYNPAPAPSSDEFDARSRLRTAAGNAAAIAEQVLPRTQLADAFGQRRAAVGGPARGDHRRLVADTGCPGTLAYRAVRRPTPT